MSESTEAGLPAHLESSGFGRLVSTAWVITKEGHISELRAAEADDRTQEIKHLLVLLLAVHSGAMDVLGFLALKAFTSVQTGNMVLAGLGVSTDDWQQVFHSVLAIVVFALGCVVGARIAGVPQPEDGPWPPEVTRALLVQLVVMVSFAIGWWLVNSDPGDVAMVVFLTMNCFGMGIQSAAVVRFATAGLSTTYFTGMLTMTMVRAAQTGPSDRTWKNLQTIGAVVVGAAAGGLLLRYAAWSVPVLQIGCLGAAILGGRFILQARADSTTG